VSVYVARSLAKATGSIITDWHWHTHRLALSTVRVKEVVQFFQDILARIDQIIQQ
jgi:hypothetical protein